MELGAFGKRHKQPQSNQKSHGDFRTHANLGGDGKLIGIALHIGQTHAGAKSHVANLVARRGPAFRHGFVNVRDAGASVARADEDFSGHDLEGELPTQGVNDQVDLRFVSAYGDSAHNRGTDAQLLHLPLDSGGYITGRRHVTGFNGICFFNHRLPPILPVADRPYRAGRRLQTWSTE